MVIKKEKKKRLPFWLCFKPLFSNQEPCDFLHEVTPQLLQKAVSEGWRSNRERKKEEERGERLRWGRGWKEMGERRRECRAEGSVWLSGCMWKWRGGYLRLTGNLFLPFSLNGGCDWLCCVTTNLLHAGEQSLKKADSQQSQNNSRMPQGCQWTRQTGEVCSFTFPPHAWRHANAIRLKSFIQ